TAEGVDGGVMVGVASGLRLRSAATAVGLTSRPWPRAIPTSNATTTARNIANQVGRPASGGGPSRTRPLASSEGLPLTKPPQTVSPRTGELHSLKGRRPRAPPWTSAHDDSLGAWGVRGRTASLWDGLV